MDVEILGNGAADMALEQQRQTQSGDRQREDDRRDAAGDQAQPQRVPAHPTDSGIR